MSPQQQLSMRREVLAIGTYMPGHMVEPAGRAWRNLRRAMGLPVVASTEQVRAAIAATFGAETSTGDVAEAAGRER